MKRMSSISLQTEVVSIKQRAEGSSGRGNGVAREAGGAGRTGRAGGKTRRGNEIQAGVCFHLSNTTCYVHVRMQHYYGRNQ